MTKQDSPCRCWGILNEVNAGDVSLNEPQRQHVNAVVVQAGCERIPRGVNPRLFCLKQFLAEMQREGDEWWRQGQAEKTLNTYYRLDQVDFPLVVRTVAVILGVERQEAGRLMAELIRSGELVRTRRGWPGNPRYWRFRPAPQSDV
jgi:hypothetical protein